MFSEVSQSDEEEQEQEDFNRKQETKEETSHTEHTCNGQIITIGDNKVCVSITPVSDTEAQGEGVCNDCEGDSTNPLNLQITVTTDSKETTEEEEEEEEREEKTWPEELEICKSEGFSKKEKNVLISLPEITDNELTQKKGNYKEVLSEVVETLSESQKEKNEEFADDDTSSDIDDYFLKKGSETCAGKIKSLLFNKRIDWSENKEWTEKIKDSLQTISNHHNDIREAYEKTVELKELEEKLEERQKEGFLDYKEVASLNYELFMKEKEHEKVDVYELFKDELKKKKEITLLTEDTYKALRENLSSFTDENDEFERRGRGSKGKSSSYPDSSSRDSGFIENPGFSSTPF